MILLKLLLIAATVYGSSVAARHGGHTLSGLVTGLPMIVGPILALVLFDVGPLRTREIALATLVCFPATSVHSVVFSWASSRWPWSVCLALATVAYLVVASMLSWLALPPVLVCVLAALAPSIAVRFMPRPCVDPSGVPVGIPRVEVMCRIAAALVMAGLIIAGANTLPSFLSGLLLAIPIAGTVLPCFTLPRYGSAATQALLRGFAKGLHGFCAFCVALYALLAVAPPWTAFVGALACAAGIAWMLSWAVFRPR